MDFSADSFYFNNFLILISHLLFSNTFCFSGLKSYSASPLSEGVSAGGFGLFFGFLFLIFIYVFFV